VSNVKIVALRPGAHGYVNVSGRYVSDERDALYEEDDLLSFGEPVSFGGLASRSVAKEWGYLISLGRRALGDHSTATCENPRYSNRDFQICVAS